MVENILNIAKSLALHHPLWCYFFVFLVSFMESFAFIGLVMPGAGFAFGVGVMAYHRIFNIIYVIIAGGIGAVVADILSFLLAKFIREKEIFFKIQKKYGVHIKKGEDFFERYGGISVFIGRFVGFLRPVIPFVGGLLNMNLYIFLFFSSISGILWGISYFGAGYLFAMGIYHVKFIDIKIIILIFLILFLGYKQIIKRTKRDRL